MVAAFAVSSGPPNGDGLMGTDFVEALVVLATGVVFLERAVALWSGRWRPDERPSPQWWPGDRGWTRWLQAFAPAAVAILTLALAFVFVLLEDGGIDGNATVAGFAVFTILSLLAAATCIGMLLTGRPRFLMPKRLRQPTHS